MVNTSDGENEKTVSKMLDPCRISLAIDTINKEDDA
jgi:hypothetical protein